MSEFKGSQTEKNMRAALVGESLARNNYTFYAEQARMEGNHEIMEMFERMARNETAHAKIWFSYINGGLGTSLTNVQKSAQGETDEYADMYPGFAKTAREEGLESVALLFDRVAAIERDHAETFLHALASLTQVAAPTTAAAPAQSADKYRCMFCGATFEDRPDACPLCGAIGSYEEITK